MDLELSADEAALADVVRDVLDGISPPSVVRAVYEGEADGTDVWRRMAELDWPGLAIAEQHGGVGMGFVELAIVVDQLGRTSAPGPFLATATQFVPAVQELGSGELRDRTLRAVASGERTGSLALAERPGEHADDDLAPLVLGAGPGGHRRRALEEPADEPGRTLGRRAVERDPDGLVRGEDQPGQPEVAPPGRVVEHVELDHRALRHVLHELVAHGAERRVVGDAAGEGRRQGDDDPASRERDRAAGPDGLDDHAGLVLADG